MPTIYAADVALDRSVVLAGATQVNCQQCERLTHLHLTLRVAHPVPGRSDPMKQDRQVSSGLMTRGSWCQSLYLSTVVRPTVNCRRSEESVSGKPLFSSPSLVHRFQSKGLLTVSYCGPMNDGVVEMIAFGPLGYKTNESTRRIQRRRTRTIKTVTVDESELTRKPAGVSSRHIGSIATPTPTVV